MKFNDIETNEVFLWNYKTYAYISIKLSVIGHFIRLGNISSIREEKILFFESDDLYIDKSSSDIEDDVIRIGKFNLESILIDPGAELHDEVLKTWINKTKDFSFFEKLSDPFIINDLLIFIKNNKYCVLNNEKQFEKIDSLLTNFGIKEIKNLKLDLPAKEVIEYIENE